MLVPTFITTRAKLILPAAASAVLILWPAVLSAAPAVLPVSTEIATASALPAHDQGASNPDSVSLHEEAKEAQARFERFREARIPPELGGFGGGCDELVGRFCLRFEDGEDESEWSVPEEPVEFGMARVRVLRELREVHNQIPGDSWILGQRVFYMGEVGDWRGAENLIRRCGGGNWWCTSLLGFVRHGQGDWNTAADLFTLAKSQMPEGENFLHLALLLDPDALEVYEGSSDQEAAEERLWLLSDPLYLVDGNDRMTEQYARAVLVRMRRDSVNPYGVDWGDDIEELTLRYGAEKAWERRRAIPNGTLQDTRSIVGRHHPKSQEFLPPDEALVDPAEVAASDWTLEQERPWTGYAPPYAPDLNALETQVARFRRGDSLLVAGAFAPEEEDVATDARRQQTRNPRIVDFRARRNQDRGAQQARTNPFGRPIEEPEPFFPEEAEPEGPVQSGLFLIDTESGVTHKVLGEGPQGAFQLKVPNGRYVVGIEAFSPDAKQAWRDRHGLWQDPLFPGLAAMSDLLILEGGGEIPTSLDEALPTALPAVRVRVGESIKVAWELYGLAIGESASVRIGVDQGGPGFIRRLGAFLRVLEPDSPVVITFEDAGPDVLGTVFRAVRLGLADLEPGEYTLTVEIELPGRETMAQSRPLLIVP
jgi:hypothetical protein